MAIFGFLAWRERGRAMLRGGVNRLTMDIHNDSAEHLVVGGYNMMGLG
jgi:hypothetical protein